MTHDSARIVRVRRVLSRSANRRKVRFDRLEDRTVLSNAFSPVGIIPDEILVQYRPDANVQQRGSNRYVGGFGLLEEIDSAQRLNFGEGMIELVKVPAGMTTETAVAWLSRQPGVEFAEPNQILTIAATSDDTQYVNGSLWGMYGSDSPAPIGPAGTTNSFGIHAENAWNAGNTGSKSVYVGIIDTGVQVNHPDLAANIWVNPYDPVDGVDNDRNGFVDDTNGWDFAANDRTVYDSTNDSHGTHVAGTIGGVGDNATGVAGVNWDVTMIVAKFISGNSGLTSNAIRAIDYVTDLKVRHGLNIVATNNSWGGGSYSSAMHAAIIRAAKADILFVAAAGNSAVNIDTTVFYPAAYSTLQAVGSTTAASYESVISVASITSTGGLSSFSNFGVSRVDIGAPGSNIMSTLPVNTYGSYNGTSMATPHVTGSIALLKSVRTGATAVQLRNAILASATPTSSLTGRVATGGRLNVFAAINHSSWNTVPGPSLTAVVADVSVNEGNTGFSNLTFTVSLSAPAVQNVTIGYATQNVTAISGVDYVANSGTLIIPAGSSTGTIAVSVAGDTIFEANETFRLVLTSATNATILDGDAVGTIINDDTRPTLSIGSASLVEGNTGSSAMSFRISMSNAADAPITVSYATSNLTATAGVDYLATTGTLTIPAGATSSSISVPIVGDNEVESDETFAVTLSNPSSNATIGTGTGTGTIFNDDAVVVPSITVANASTPEGNSGTSTLTFIVSLSTATTVPVSVNYGTSNGTALLGTDYLGTTGTLTIPAGSTSGSIAVSVFGDTTFEPDETFSLTLSGAVNGTISVGTAIGTIVNDDTAPVLTIGNANVVEGDSGTTNMTFGVTLSNASSTAVTVNFVTSGITATSGTDFVSTSGILTIPAGSTAGTIVVPVVGDTVVESDETFAVTLSNPSSNATIGTGTGTGTIFNDDAVVVPSITVANASTPEGNSGTSTLTFIVSLSTATTVPVSVNYGTSNGTALLGTDYLGTTGTLTIPAGSTSGSIAVSVFGDTTFEPDETFSLTLSGAVNGTISVGTAIGTIVNDDTAPVLTIGNANVVEGDSGTTNMTFGVTLSNASSTAVTVNFVTSGITATSGTDFVSTSGILTIPAGSTAGTIVVPVVGDTVVESDETFVVTLSNPSSNATIGAGAGTGTIVNDDIPSIEMSVADVSFLEGNSGWNFMDFEVVLNAPSAWDVSVSYLTSDGTASSRGNTADYRSAVGTLVIPAGQRSGLIRVSVKGDRTLEQDETFSLVLGDVSTGVILTRKVAIGTIVNDDTTVNLGPRGGSTGNEQFGAVASDEIIASPVPELDFVLGEWSRSSRKPGRGE